MTPMHAILNKSVRVLRILSYGRIADEKVEDCVDVIEQVAASDDDDINAKDHLGSSRLHVLCTFKDSSRLERYLNDIEDVNHAVNADSPFCPGFTPLHFTALFNLDSLKLLLAKGADITIKDADGNSPLDLCIARYSIEDIHDIIARSTCKDVALSNGRAKLTDLVYSMRSLSNFNTLLRELGDVNVYIPVDSPLWPGHTPLHLAIIFHERCNSDEKKKKMFYELIEECLKKGSGVGTKGVLDQTPLQFAFRRGQVNVVNLMFGYHSGSWNPVDIDGLSHLHIACAAKKQSLVKKLLNNGADVNCKLGSTFKWYVERKFGFRSYSCTSNPRVFLCDGSTPLHITVAVGDLEIMKSLLERGADLQARDVNGLSPVHRLITSYDSYRLCAELLSSENLRECVVDSCGLSHLHVACYVKHLDAVKRLLLEPESQVNRAIKIKTTSESLFGCEAIPGFRESYVDRYGDPSADSLSVLVPFDGFTPLLVAMRHHDNEEVVELLLRHDADVLASSAEGSVPLYEVMNRHCRYWPAFASVIGSNEAVRRRLVERVSGLTDLHLACREGDIARINELLSEGADVNARIREDSPIWSGYTPLHVHMRTGVPDKPDAVLQLLLDKGADVTVAAAYGSITPLHMTDSRKFCSSLAGDQVGYRRLSECCSSSYYEKRTLPEFPCDNASLMLRSIQDFSSNPVNVEGVSHFYIACWCLDVVAVEEFLKHGVDVNARVDYFSKVYGGYTPLHVTLTRDARSPRKKKIVELLLKHGVDVHVERYSGNTALHYAAKYHEYVDMSIFTMIFNAGADINAKNVDGASPLEILLANRYVKIRKLYHFIEHGCRINDFNGATDEGLMAMIIESSHSREKEKIKKLLLSSPDIGGVDKAGRTAIHNIVSTYSPTMSERYYVDLIEGLEKLGTDVDHQDKSGQTALHAAARFQNDQAISALLAIGADVNITDAAGKTAFAYSLISRRVYNRKRDDFDEVFSKDAIELFAIHAHKLQLAGLHINAFNEDSQRIAKEKHCRYVSMMDKHQFHAILDNVDNVKVGCQSLTVRDFVSANGPVWKYSKMRRMNRELVVDLFGAILDKRYEETLGELRCLVKLQYRNYLAKSQLVETAKIALTTMVVNVAVPDLCSEAILAHLESWELRNILVAAS